MFWKVGRGYMHVLKNRKVYTLYTLVYPPLHYCLTVHNANCINDKEKFYFILLYFFFLSIFLFFQYPEMISYKKKLRPEYKFNMYVLGLFQGVTFEVHKLFDPCSLFL